MRFGRVAVIGLILSALVLTPVSTFAQKSGSKSGSSFSSSKPSSSGSKSGSSSSKPKFSSSAPKQQAPSSSSKPKFSSSAPKQQAPSTSSSKPKFSSSPKPADKPVVTESKPKFSSSKPADKPVVSTKPKTEPSKPVVTESKPKFSSSKPTVVDSKTKKPPTIETEKSRANKMEASKRSYAEQQKATAPPKNTYVASNGKAVNIDLKDKSVETIRNKPTSYHQPEVRRNRVETHIHHYHYPHNYDYYYQRPYYHVGGGYSSAFWWMMMDWNAERRAMWLYHNRDNIERSAYEEGLRDGKVKAQLEALERQNIARDENYVDTEFKENPSDMYDVSYIEATYNPTIKETPVVVSRPMTPEEQAAAASVFKWIIISMLGVAALGGMVWFATCVRFGK